MNHILLSAFTILNILIYLSGLTFAQTTYEGHSGGPSISYKYYSEEEAVITFYFPEPTSTFSKPGGFSDAFCHFQMNGSGIAGKPGYPALPLYLKWIELPADIEFWYEILKGDSVVFPFVPFPWQKPTKRNDTNTFEVLWYDESFYNSTEPFPFSPVEFRAFRHAGGRTYAEFIFNPLIYYPESKQTIFYKQLTLKINFKNKIQLQREEIPAYNSLSLRFLPKNILVSPEKKWATDPAYIPALLIICNDAFYDNIKPYAEWKQRMGYKTTVVKTSQVSPTLSADTIRQYIRNKVNDKNDSFPPTHVLLVGDVSYIPTFKGVNDALNDHGYSLINGDYLADISIGRFSVNTTAECDTYVKKTLNYEKFPDLTLSGSWFMKATVAASNDRLDNSHGMHMVSYLTKEGFYFVDDLRATLNKFTNLNILQALNAGRSWMFYIGHGTETAWSTLGAFTRYNVDNDLKNYGALPAVVSVACLNNALDYQYGDCFGERWMNTAANRGACVFVGATEDTPFYLSDTLGKFTLFGYFEGDAANMGDALIYGKYKMYEAFPNNTNKETEETMQHFLLLGDPTLMPWTSFPFRPEVEHPLYFSTPGKKQLHLRVTLGGTPVKDALVCVSNENFDIWERARTNDSGFISFDINCADTGYIHLVVSGRNLIPYIDSIGVGTYRSVKELNEIGLVVYPNPSDQYFRVKSDTEKEIKQIQLFDINGKLLLSKINFRNEEKMTIDEDLSPGIYLLKVLFNDGSTAYTRLISK